MAGTAEEDGSARDTDTDRTDIVNDEKNYTVAISSQLPPDQPNHTFIHPGQLLCNSKRVPLLCTAKDGTQSSNYDIAVWVALNSLLG